MSPKELAITINALAISIAEGRSDEEIAALSAIFMQIGDTLSLLTAQKELLNSLGKKALLPQDDVVSTVLRVFNNPAVSPQQSKDA